MDRSELLDAALGAVTVERAGQYGELEDNFGRIAALWTAYLGPRIGAALSPEDVASMMVLLKVARITGAPVDADTSDSWVDIAGYAACGAEVASDARKVRLWDVVPRKGEKGEFGPSEARIEASAQTVASMPVGYGVTVREGGDESWVERRNLF